MNINDIIGQQSTGSEAARQFAAMNLGTATMAATMGTHNAAQMLDASLYQTAAATVGLFGFKLKMRRW